MGDGNVGNEIPLLSWSLHLLSEAEARPFGDLFVVSRESTCGWRSRSVLRTVPDGEFDWGGTSVK